MTTLAGYSHAPSSPESMCGTADGTGTQARFCFLYSVQAGPDGNLLAADTTNHTVRRIAIRELVETAWFPQFASGSGVTSTLVLGNPSRTVWARGRVEFFDRSGAPQTPALTGLAADSAFELPPLGLRLFRSVDSGQLMVGSAVVHSNLPLSGTVVYSPLRFKFQRAAS